MISTPSKLFHLETTAIADRLEKMRILRSLAETPGAARSLFADDFAKLGSNHAPIGGIQYGRHVTTAYKIGANEISLSPADDKDRQAEHVGMMMPSSVPLGAAPANKVLTNGVIMTCGVCVIIGGADAGKSPAAIALAANNVESYSHVRAGEPLAGYLNSEVDIGEALMSAMLTSTDVVLDSIKDILGSGGALTTGGVSRDTITSISSWSAFACGVGATIYVPLNPSVNKPEVVEAVFEMGRSNAVTLLTPGEEKNTWNAISRTGEALMRKSWRAEIRFTDGVANLAGRQRGGDVPEKQVTAHVAHEMHSAALRRAMIEK